MQYGLALLRKLFAHRQGQIDPQFDLRLQRIGAREQLRQAQTSPLRGSLKNPPARRAV